MILQVVDQRWREHLENMDYLREGVHLRAMAQKDPLVEYRHEGHLMFEELGRLIRSEVVSLALPRRGAGRGRPALQELQEFEDDGDGYAYEHQSLAGSEAIAAAGAAAAVGAFGHGGRGRRGRRRGRIGRDAAARRVASSTRSGATTHARAARARSTRSATGRRVVAETTQTVEEHLQGIGTQLDWVRDYL